MPLGCYTLSMKDKRAFSILLLIVSIPIFASPPPGLGWKKGSVVLEPSPQISVEMTLLCPEGKFKEISAKIKGRKSSVNASMLKKFSLTETCSGMRTNAEYEDEANTRLLGISVTVTFTSEYSQRELWLDWDLKKQKFTEASWSVTESGGKTKTEKLAF